MEADLHQLTTKTQKNEIEVNKHETQESLAQCGCLWCMSPGKLQQLECNCKHSSREFSYNTSVQKHYFNKVTCALTFCKYDADKTQTLNWNTHILIGSRRVLSDDMSKVQRVSQFSTSNAANLLTQFCPKQPIAGWGVIQKTGFPRCRKKGCSGPALAWE